MGVGPRCGSPHNWGPFEAVIDETRTSNSWGRVATEFLRRNVLGLIAIFIALSGTAYANMKVGAGDIERNAVRAANIAKKQVRAKHLARNSVRPAHLAKRAVRPRHLLPGGVKGWAIADGAITTDKLAEDVASKLVPDPSLVDGRAMGGDLTGTFPNPEIAPGAVDTLKLSEQSVTTEKIAPLAVGTAQLNDGAITPTKIQNAAVGTQELADDAVTNAKLDTNSVRGRNFFNSGTYELSPGTINAGSCTGFTLFPAPPGPAVGLASLSPGAEPGLVAVVGYFNNQSQFGVRVCNMTATSLPRPASFNWLFIAI